MMTDVFVHESAEVDPSARIGPGTKVWHLVQIRPGVSVGQNCVIGRDVYIDEDIQIGNNVKIQNRASLYKSCVIEDGVFIGPHVCFTNDTNPRAINPDGTLKSANDWHAGSSWVGGGAAIGAGSIILPSKRIGRFAMVGAGSVVTHDVPDHALVVGNPARPIGFVCRCGARLVEASRDSFRCPDCTEHYVTSNQGMLTPIIDTASRH